MERRHLEHTPRHDILSKLIKFNKSLSKDDSSEHPRSVAFSNHKQAMIAMENTSIITPLLFFITTAAFESFTSNISNCFSVQT